MITKASLKRPYEAREGERAASEDVYYLEKLIKIKQVIENAMPACYELRKETKVFMPRRNEDIFSFLSRAYGEIYKKYRDKDCLKVISNQFSGMYFLRGECDYLYLGMRVANVLNLCYVMDCREVPFTTFFRVESDNRWFNPIRDLDIVRMGIDEAILQFLNDMEFGVFYDILKDRGALPTVEENEIVQASDFINELAAYNHMIDMFKSTWDIYRCVIKSGPYIPYDRENDSFFINAANWCDEMALLLESKEAPEDRSLKQAIASEIETYRKDAEKLRALDSSIAKETVQYLFDFDNKAVDSLLDSVLFKGYKTNAWMLDIATSYEAIQNAMKVIKNRYLRKCVNIGMENIIYEGLITMINDANLGTAL